MHKLLLAGDIHHNEQEAQSEDIMRRLQAMLSGIEEQKIKKQHKNLKKVPKFVNAHGSLVNTYELITSKHTVPS